ncbi:MAG: hypothetical protein R3C15_04500 [Thermoleophilia bacterium]
MWRLALAALVGLSLVVAGCRIVPAHGPAGSGGAEGLEPLPAGRPTSDPASTCDVTSVPLEAQLEAAELVFTGEVVGVGGSERTGGYQSHRLRFRVERTYLGEPPLVVDLTFLDCAFWDDARLGERYVVLAAGTGIGARRVPVTVGVGYWQGLHPVGSAEADEIARRLGS